VEFQSSLKRFRELGHASGQAESLLGVARSLRDLERFGEARAACESALGIVEEMRRQPSDERLRSIFLASRKHFYDFYVDLLMTMHTLEPGSGYDRAAFEASERSRARSLFETIRLGVKTHGVFTSESGKGSAHATSAVNKTMTLEEIQRLLNDETALLEYHLGDERSYLWLVTKDDLESFRLPPGGAIESRARQAYATLPSPAWPAIPDRHLALLSDMLLSDVAPKLKAKSLLIVGNAALQYVPFAALPLPEPLHPDNLGERLV